MRAHHVPVILAAALAAAALAPLARAETDEEFDRRILDELRARDPVAADTFALGNQAREAENHRQSAALFARVRSRVPGFSHAWRREGAALIEESKIAESVEEAIHREPSPLDSHPRPADRIAWVEERRLTDEVRQNVGAAHGVEIAPGS